MTEAFYEYWIWIVYWIPMAMAMAYSVVAAALAIRRDWKRRKTYHGVTIRRDWETYHGVTTYGDLVGGFILPLVPIVNWFIGGYAVFRSAAWFLCFISSKLNKPVIPRIKQ